MRYNRYISLISGIFILSFLSLIALPVFGASLTDPSASANDTGNVTVNLTAMDTAFNMSTITVPAGSNVTVNFYNRDADEHNFAVYDAPDARNTIFRGEEITGPNTNITYRFRAPDTAGTYFFRCDDHPDRMTGQFIVR